MDTNLNPSASLSESTTNVMQLFGETYPVEFSSLSWRWSGGLLALVTPQARFVRQEHYQAWATAKRDLPDNRIGVATKFSFDDQQPALPLGVFGSFKLTEGGGFEVETFRIDELSASMAIGGGTGNEYSLSAHVHTTFCDDMLAGGLFLADPIRPLDSRDFDFFDSVIGPEGQRVVAYDLDLDRVSDVIPFFVVTGFEGIVGQAFNEGKNLLALAPCGPWKLEKLYRN